MKVAVYSTHAFDKPYLLKAAGKHELVFIDAELDAGTAQLAAGCGAVALFTSDNAKDGVLEKLAQLGVKYIVLRSAGFDHVDLQKAAAAGLKVANVPAYSPYAVAEHAVMLLLALNRRLALSQELLRQHDFRLDRLTGGEIHGKTAGIIGAGKIGEAFARIMHGFGCRLLCFDPQPKPVLEKELNLRFVSFPELCMESDIISIHCPLNKETRHLFNRHSFSLMEKAPVLINTARGGIINTADLVAALNSGTVGAAGLDVYEFEKGLFFRDHHNEATDDVLFGELLAQPNVLITGHQAFLTETALRNIAETTAYNLDCYENGIACPNELHASDHPQA